MSGMNDAAFAASIEKIEHADRLKASLRAMIEGVALPKGHAHGILEGDENPEDRITLAVEFAKAVKAEEPGSLFLWASNKELGVKGLREVAALLTPPTRTPKITNSLAFVDVSDNAATNYGEDVGPLRDLCFQLARVNLKGLSLHNNTLRFDGASIVARLLRYSKTLRFLDLSRCQIGERGAQALYASFVHDDDFVPEDLAEEDRGTSQPGGSAEATAARRASQLSATGGLEAAAAAAVASGSNADAGGVNPLADPRLAAIHALNPPPTPRLHAPAAVAEGGGAGSASAPGGEGAAGAAGPVPAATGSVRPGSAGLKRPGSATVSRPGSSSSRRAQAALGIGGRSNVESSNTTLTHLDLSSNNLAGYDNPMPCSKLVRALAEHPSLVWLNLSRNRFTRSIIGQLLAGLESNRSLRTLILEADNIDAVPSARMADILASHPSLEVLNLRFNSVRSDGALAFAKMLGASTLPYANAVAHEIIASASHAHSHGHRRVSIDADGIGTDDSGHGKASAPVTFAGSRLRSLDLRGNYIGPIGTRAMLEALGVVFPASMPAEGSGAASGSAAALAAAEAARHEEEKAAAAAAAAQTHKQMHSARPNSSAHGAGDDHHEEPDTDAGASGVVLAGSGSRALQALKRQQRKAALRALGLGVTHTIAEEDEAAAAAEEADDGAEGTSTTSSSTSKSDSGAVQHETTVTTSVSVTSEGDIVQLVTVTVTIAPPAAPAPAAGAGGKPAAHGKPAPAAAPKPRVITRSFSRVVRMDGEVVSKVMADRLAHIEIDRENAGHAAAVASAAAGSAPAATVTTA